MSDSPGAPRPMSIEQGWARAVGVIRRRRGPILLGAGVTLALATLVVWRLDPAYRASAVVRVLESQPSKDYVPPTVAEQIGERLKTLRLAVMSRPLLTQVAEELGLPGKLGRPLAAVVDGMRARMEVKVEGEDTFLVSYEDADAERARAVVDRLAARFVDDQVARREAIAAASVQALDDEVRALGPELSRVQTSVRDFKISHAGSLPEQLESNLRTLDETTLEVNIQATNLDLEHDRRRQLLASAMSPLRHQEDLLQTALHEARLRYTADHPEVRRVETELSLLQGRRAVEEQALRSSAGTSPELASLDGEIRHTEAAITGLRARQDEARRRIAETAENGQALDGLMVGLEVVRGKYQAALGKLHDAELARTVERRLRGLRYQLVEGAALPRAAAHPNKPLWEAGGLVLAALIGLGIGFALDRRDSSIHGPAELAGIAEGLPVLACVPTVESGDEGGGDGPQLH